MRAIVHHYSDPLELIWIGAARRCGLSVQRSDQVYAAYDGKGTLLLADRNNFDADDCLAQYILHEICHALVQGPQSLAQVDWGLENRDGRDRQAEHAAVRLQAALAATYDLRQFFAITTDFRPYFDALPADPLADDDDATRLAIAGYQRAQADPWKTALERAFAATVKLRAIVECWAPANSLWRADQQSATKKSR